VEAPDFSPEAECGHGLHGYLRGCGDGIQINFDGLFQVVKVLESEIIDLNGKVKFPRCEVILTGSQQEATNLFLQEYPGLPIIGAEVVVGDHGVAVVGYRGIASAGDHGKASAGNRGTASAGHRGTASAGDVGIASAGHGGKASAGDDGTASAGDYGRLRLLWWDHNNSRYREEIAYVGENGIKPNVKYQLDDQHKFVEKPINEVI
jgi:hypothetical protein